jgi:hypothetical protein
MEFRYGNYARRNSCLLFLLFIITCGQTLFDLNVYSCRSPESGHTWDIIISIVVLLISYGSNCITQVSGSCMLSIYLGMNVSVKLVQSAYCSLLLVSYVRCQPPETTSNTARPTYCVWLIDACNWKCFKMHVVFLTYKFTVLLSNDGGIIVWFSDL